MIGKPYTPKTFYSEPGIDSNWLDFGLILREDLSQEQQDINEALANEFTGFPLAYNEGDEFLLYKLWEHDLVKAALGKPYPGVHQLTGSCVGAGGGDALFSLTAADVIVRHDAEKIHLPFWLLPYGVSRELMGFRGQGEGSSGDTFAAAVAKGTPPLGHPDFQGLPEPQWRDGLTWSTQVEFQWSYGAPQSWREKALAYPTLKRTRITSLSEAHAAISNYYPLTLASSWGGAMRPQVKDGHLVNRRVTRWNHQMSCHGWKKRGLWLIKNQWGDCHGRCPSGAPAGSFWIEDPDMEWIIRTGQVYAFADQQGWKRISYYL